MLGVQTSEAGCSLDLSRTVSLAGKDKKAGDSGDSPPSQFQDRLFAHSSQKADVVLSLRLFQTPVPEFADWTMAVQGQCWRRVLIPEIPDLPEETSGCRIPGLKSHSGHLGLLSVNDESEVRIPALHPSQSQPADFQHTPLILADFPSFVEQDGGVVMTTKTGFPLDPFQAFLLQLWLGF
jgi:hypothetical protein